MVLNLLNLYIVKIDKKKLERQEIGVDKWFNSSRFGATKDCQGTYHYYTGVGKTYTAILVIKRLFRINPKHNIVIIVPANVLNQWKSIIEKTFTKKQQVVINLFTPHYIVNNKVKIQTGTLIVDELHECYSDEFIKVVDGTYIRYDNNLGLTATYEDSKGRHKLIEDKFPIIDAILETEAIKEGYVSPYIEFNIGVDLTEKEKEQYNRLSDVISKNINKFPKGYGLKLATKCLSGDKGRSTHKDGKQYTGIQYVYGYASSKGWRKDLDLSNPRDAQINDLWNPSKIFGYAQSLLNAIRHRKNILYNAEEKAQMSLNICFKFYELKTIVFSQSTAFADKLHLMLNEQEANSCVVYHSSLETTMLPSPKTGKLIKFGKTRLKRMAIEKIRNGDARIITTASSLDKGFDVTDLGLGITASGTSNFTQYKQRGGRVKRKDLFNPNKRALLVNLYVKNTRDEDWLKSRQSKSYHTIYWTDDINDISFNPIIKDDITIHDI